MILSSTEFTVENKDRIRRILVEKLALSTKILEYTFTPTIINVQQNLLLIKSKFPLEYQKLAKCSLNGIGPGEILLYFLCDNLSLSGFKHGVDTYVNDNPFCEIKSVRKTSTGQLFDFKFGSVIQKATNATIQEIQKIMISHNFLGESFSEISRSKIDELRKLQSSRNAEKNIKLKNNKLYYENELMCHIDDPNVRHILRAINDKIPKSFADLENEFVDTIFKLGIGETNFIFFNRTSNDIEYAGKLKREWIKIHRITQNNIKPLINFNNF